MQYLLSADVLSACDGLKLMVYNFLQPNVTEKAKKSFVRSVGTLVNPIKSSVKSVPTASKDIRTDDIPFRIMLLLMDEVFNLRNKDLWFREELWPC
ncbi:sorting nexin-13 [Caerostris extrusa]|uniref:Sorting nexin-13 n=1 Tax=Caerostris extrusa TaxID=172846 RepID=A0AAV4WYA9_CAEEX|nr:sorting nexin-13 [Caerostris extrusa]